LFGIEGRGVDQRNAKKRNLKKKVKRFKGFNRDTKKKEYLQKVPKVRSGSGLRIQKKITGFKP